jgi:DNA-binding PadR family transcriptional regulator
MLAPAISIYDAGMKAFLAGAIQMHVLHHAAEHEVHGAWMTAELARHGHKVSPGTLYPALHRMEAAGLLTGRDALVNSRRVRYYAITGAGRAELAASRETLQQLADELLGSPRKRPKKPPT